MGSGNPGKRASYGGSLVRYQDVTAQFRARHPGISTEDENLFARFIEISRLNAKPHENLVDFLERCWDAYRKIMYYPLGHVPVRVDPELPRDTIQLRGRDGRLMGEITNLGTEPAPEPKKARRMFRLSRKG